MNEKAAVDEHTGGKDLKKKWDSESDQGDVEDRDFAEGRHDVPFGAGLDSYEI